MKLHLNKIILNNVFSKSKTNGGGTEQMVSFILGEHKEDLPCNKVSFDVHCFLPEHSFMDMLSDFHAFNQGILSKNLFKPIILPSLNVSHS